MNSQLWHMCAGPLVSLPQIGSLMVYFPQAHNEQVSFFQNIFVKKNTYILSPNRILPFFYCFMQACIMMRT